MWAFLLFWVLTSFVIGAKCGRFLARNVLKIFDKTEPITQRAITRKAATWTEKITRKCVRKSKKWPMMPQEHRQRMPKKEGVISA